MLDETSLQTGADSMPNTNLGNQFDKVAKLIKVGTRDLEMERAAFVTSLGGFDTHNDEGEKYDSLMKEVE